MDHLFEINLSWFQFFVFAVAGIGTGIINTLAGSGSLITLPIFMFMCGLPAPVANGTNRIGVMMQSLVGGVSFYRQGHLVTKNLGWLVVPMLIGAITGASVAVDLNEEKMNMAIGILMAFMLVVLLVQPKRWIQASIEEGGSRNSKWYNIIIFLGIGFYGGFIQAGVGIFLLAALVLAAKYDLIQATAIKMIAVIVFSVPALIIFFSHGQVAIAYGLLMALFQSIGAVIGVRFVSKIPNANILIHRLLILIVFVSALKMFGILDMILSYAGLS
ncbi:MAG: sulfite exporter TauE/SafE family protein [Bacteroidia bacterium]|nr:sulfite exporter TauE/SafE family protein [Bacteroidia bacterium]